MKLSDVSENEFMFIISEIVPTIWRFLPLVDPLVGEFHSRDLDSQCSQRELDAVLEFQNTKYAQFHIMRDHKMHSAPMLGNLFKNSACFWTGLVSLMYKICTISH